MSSGNDATGNHASDPGGTPPVDDGSADTTTPPPDGKTKRNRWRTVRRVSLVVIALLLVIPLVGFLVSYVRAEVPRPSDMKTNQVATVFAADGTTELTKVIPPEGNRTEIALDAIPQHVRDAVLSAEDRNFYSNPGFSVTGFMRAARDNVLGKESAGGGSTITQQYVKNVLVGADRNVYRKMRELVISTKMAREWSKDEILAAYLNTIYFGRGAYGIERRRAPTSTSRSATCRWPRARCSPP